MALRGPRGWLGHGGAEIAEMRQASLAQPYAPKLADNVRTEGEQRVLEPSPDLQAL